MVKKQMNNGFTLLEVIVAMSILVIGILATMGMAFWSVRNVTTGNIVTQATLLAQARVEQIKHVIDVKDLPGLFVAENDVVPVDGGGTAIVGGGIFDIAYAFTDPIKDAIIAAGDPAPELPNCATGNNDGSGTCLAVVTVTWQRGGGGRGAAGSVELHTLTHGEGI